MQIEDDWSRTCEFVASRRQAGLVTDRRRRVRVCGMLMIVGRHLWSWPGATIVNMTTTPHQQVLVIVRVAVRQPSLTAFGELYQKGYRSHLGVAAV